MILARETTPLVCWSILCRGVRWSAAPCRVYPRYGCACTVQFPPYIIWRGEESGELHSIGPVAMTRKLVSSTIAPVPIAFNEVEVANQDVERALLHVDS